MTNIACIMYYEILTMFTVVIVVEDVTKYYFLDITIYNDLSTQTRRHELCVERIETGSFLSVYPV